MDLPRNRCIARVVQRLDNAIHRINHYPADSVICFVNIYPQDSDLSGGYRYPAFEQLGPGEYTILYAIITV